MTQELIELIKADPAYATFRNIVRNTQKSLNIQNSLDDALSLHNSRVLRDLKGEQRYSPKLLIDANLTDLSFRSRLVDMRVRNDVKLSTLREALDAIRGHISTQYSTELKSFSTVDQRRAFVDRAVKNSAQLLADGEALLTTIDALIKDIDQSNFHFKTIIECLKLMDSSKTGTTV